MSKASNRRMIAGRAAAVMLYASLLLALHSSDAMLCGLTLSHGMLSPGFAAGRRLTLYRSETS